MPNGSTIDSYTGEIQQAEGEEEEAEDVAEFKIHSDAEEEVDEEYKPEVTVSVDLDDYEKELLEEMRISAPPALRGNKLSLAWSEVQEHLQVLNPCRQDSSRFEADDLHEHPWSRAKSG